jgi:hypothetical protein
MPNGNHRLTRQQAKKLIDDLKNIRGGSNGPFRNLPDGFIFPVEVIRNLIKHVDAVNFVIQLGWKATGPGGSQANMTPVLFVTDSNNKALGEIPIASTGGSADSSMVATSSSGITESSSTSETGGGFINEGLPFPPPTVSTDE